MTSKESSSAPITDHEREQVARANETGLMPIVRPRPLAAPEQLGPLARRENLLVLPLHGALSSEDQDRALRPSVIRKVVQESTSKPPNNSGSRAETKSSSNTNWPSSAPSGTKRGNTCGTCTTANSCFGPKPRRRSNVAARYKPRL
jgi:hypothetical protein